MDERKEKTIPILLRVQVKGHEPYKTTSICMVLSEFGLGREQGWDGYMLYLYGISPIEIISAEAVKAIYGTPRAYADEIRDRLIDANGEICSIDVEIDILSKTSRVSSYACEAELIP